MPELVADLVRRRPVIAVTGGDIGVLAAKAATTTIPIVFEIGNDPVELGLVASFNRPGGNLTGVTAMNLDLFGKRLSLLTEMVPAAKRIGVLLPDLTSPFSRSYLEYLPTATAALGRQFEVLVAPATSRDIDEVFSTLARRQLDALHVTPNPNYNSLRVQITTAAARYGVAALYSGRAYVDAGGLMSYGSSTEENWRLVGNYVGRILKGEKPADLPVVRPTRFEFVLNLHTARLLRLEIPPTLLAIADSVIE